MKKIIYSFVAFASLIIAGCDKKDDYSSADLNEYLNLEVGKFVVYRLDSLLYVNFGQKDTIISYQAKDVIDEAITDNLGRPSFRVVRYLSDTTGSSPWVPTATFMLTPMRETVEQIENNMRYQKLKLPVKEGFNWKGNSYISTQSPEPTWEYRFLDDWDYTYENVGAPFILPNNQSVDNTITVNQRDEIIGFPNEVDAYSEKSYSKEVYGAGIGLIFRDFLHWEYQPPNGGNPGYKTGFGIKMVMISHN
ncbi:MAG: hypothetical protein H7Y31_14355 [Chitinophagaceae bacterium]|nr:hypothetical protein [Chitinophagaceae bacterium]